MAENPEQLKALKAQVLFNEQKRKLKHANFLDGALAKITGVVMTEKKQSDDLIPSSDESEEEEEEEEESQEEENEENDIENGKQTGGFAGLMSGLTNIKSGMMTSESKPLPEANKEPDQLQNQSVQHLLAEPKEHTPGLPISLDAKVVVQEKNI